MFVQIQEPGQSQKETPSTKEVAIGIDLGTSFSLAAISQGSQPKILTTEYIPSVVSYAQENSAVGTQALQDLAEKPELVLTSIKRLMGRGAEDIQSELPLYRFKQTNEIGPIQLQVGERVLTPVEVSAEILRGVKRQAEMSLKHPISKAVITVPAYFDEAARVATKDAARLAGIEVLRLVNEPTAAALAYGLDSGAEGLYAIYDLGGGTFDFSLLNLQKGVFKVLATAGDIHLGGDDFDTALLKDVIQTHQVDLKESEYKKALYALRALKEELSHFETVQGSLNQKNFTIARSRLEGLIRPLVEKTLSICDQALTDGNVSKNDLQGIVLVGGSTRVPFVKEMVRSFFNQEPLCTLNPDQVVALGAALQAEALTSGSDTLLLDITPLSLGLETMGGIVDRIIERNSPIPISQSKVFTTYQDGQTGLQLHVVQGERDMASDCRSLARFELSGIPSMQAGSARIKVQFSLDGDGLLTVEAREELTGICQQVEVKPSYGLSEEDLEKMLIASFEHAQEDIENRLLVEARLEAKKILMTMSSALEADGHLLTSEQTEDILGTMDTLEQQVNQGGREDIDAAISTLKQLAQPFIEMRLDHVLKTIKGQAIEKVEQSLQDLQNKSILAYE